MSLAIVTEVSNRFRKAIAKWQVSPDLTLESRFLLHDGIYVGHQFQLGGFVGRWLANDNSLKIYRDGQWVMTVPLDIDIEIVQSQVAEAKPDPAATVARGRAA